MFCGKCGANIPDGYAFCMNCGTKIDISTVDFSEVPIVEPKTKKKNIKKRVLILGVVVIAVILSVLTILFLLNDSSEKNGYFANIPWGTDIESAQNKFDKAFECESKISKINKDNTDSIIASIDNYDDMQGVNAVPMLNFDENKTLNDVSVVFTPTDDSKYTTNQIADHFIQKYNKLFGDSDYETFTHKWKTKNSTIELIIYSKELIILNFTK